MTSGGLFDSRWDGAAIPVEHWHFHRHLLGRSGIVLAPGEFSKMVSDIGRWHALLIEQRPGGTAIYSVRIKSAGKRIYVVAHGPHIITAYPPKKRLNEKRRQLAKTEASGVINKSAESLP